MIGGLGIDYEKRKNTEFFRQLNSVFSFQEIQNYIPIYKKFFVLNETNYNSINFNQHYFITDIQEKKERAVCQCIVREKEDLGLFEKQVFFKFAPLLDPFKFLSGKYNIQSESLYRLPSWTLDEKNPVHSKLMDENNSSYVDSLFSFLTSQLMHQHSFVHSVDFYGSFVGIQNNFMLNVVDDLEFLTESDFFNKHKNVSFFIQDYHHLMEEDNDKIIPSGGHLPHIQIDLNNENETFPLLSSSLDELVELDELFPSDEQKETNENPPHDLIDDICLLETDTNHFTLHSCSTCSSRTSLTDEDEDDGDEDDGDEEDGDEEEDDDEDDEWETEEEEEESSIEEEEVINVTIPRFPINLICMEKCHDTLDHFILTNKITEKEWLSILMQIIMTLITYQKCFCFTHNDLHTNNVMYTKTDAKFIYYIYNKKQYKVPTYGKIFKIIDYGRAIYKYDTKIFCSDSFQRGADASTQYNIEPYFNEKKPRLEPNFSFDLCRLACSIFDHLIEDMDEIKDLDLCEPVVRIITEWCIDDNGINVLYKKDHTERYPEFKLYKMIARCVHRHTPDAQLKRPEFEAFLEKEKTKDPCSFLINLDEIPRLYK
jgi:hypothetical protein